MSQAAHLPFHDALGHDQTQPCIAILAGAPFDPLIIAVDPPILAARLWFDVTPSGRFLGLQVNGRNVTFAEHAFYRFDEGRIQEVWSIIDKAAVEKQL